MMCLPSLKVSVFEDEGTSLADKKSRSVKKQMIAIFLNSSDIVERILLGTQKTVRLSSTRNNDYLNLSNID